MILVGLTESAMHNDPGIAPLVPATIRRVNQMSDGNFEVFTILRVEPMILHGDLPVLTLATKE